jgi:hypothetical protein
MESEFSRPERSRTYRGEDRQVGPHRGKRVQEAILDECWNPAFARYLIPKYTGLRLDLDRYLNCYNTDRAHRALDEGPDARAGHREDEDVVSLGLMRRHISVTGHTSPAPSSQSNHHDSSERPRRI